MFRTLLLSAAAFVAMLALNADSVEAGRLFSLRNPYTSFNISGVNYGSMNWERQHGNRNTVYGSSRVLFAVDKKAWAWGAAKKANG